MSITRGLLDELANFDTPTVINAVEALEVSSYPNYVDGSIRCLTPELPAMVGAALTIKLDASSGGPSQEEDYRTLLDSLEADEMPRVVVVEADGPERLKECVLGDGMAKTMASLGARGLVTNGGARDIDGIAGEGFQVFGFGLVAHHADLIWHDFGRALEIGGMRVEAGDLLHGDKNGCVRVPTECYPYIIEACREVAAFEIEVHLAMRNTQLSVAQKMDTRASQVQAYRERMAELRRKHTRQ